MVDSSEKLREAAENGFKDKLKACLLDHGCNALSRDELGMTALMKAARNGHDDCARILLPVSHALAKNERGMTALMWAAHNGYEACIKVLLPASDALAKDDRGMTALMWGAGSGHEACVRLLLPKSDALATDATGWNVSQWSKNLGFKSMAKFIDAYVLAQSEQVAIGVAASSGSPCGRAVRRV